MYRGFNISLVNVQLYAKIKMLALNITREKPSSSLAQHCLLAQWQGKPNSTLESLGHLRTSERRNPQLQNLRCQAVPGPHCTPEGQILDLDCHHLARVPVMKFLVESNLDLSPSLGKCSICL